MLAVFLASAGVTSALMATDDAQAKWRRYNGVTCTSDWALWHNLVGLNNYSNVTVRATCDVGDDSDFAKTEIAGINVHVYDGHNNAPARARVCTVTWNSWFGSCGQYSNSGYGFVGNATLTPPLTPLSSAANFGMLEVELPPSSALKGYYTHD